MARRYKQTKTKTDNLGSAGSQVLIGKVDKIDAQGVNGYLHNIRVSMLLNEGHTAFTTNGGFICYLTTADTWADEDIICARAAQFADTVNLPAKRTLRQSADNVKGNMGPVYLWAECSDITASTDVTVRIVTETWGSFIEYEWV